MALKGVRKQHALAKLVGVSQPTICDMLKGNRGETPIFLKVADALDCEADFLYVRGRYAGHVDLAEGSADLREVASAMAFIFFRNTATEEHLNWCRRVLGHPAAPITAIGWRHLAEQIDRAIGPRGDGHLKAVG